MSTFFISDLHLCEQRPRITELFVHFMQTRARDASSLYILGDLFELWIGDDYVPNGLHDVIDALRHYAASQGDLYVLHGNRDFLLGEQFEVMTGCQLLPDPTIIDLNGTRTLLTHGDELCTDDVDYMEFRSQVRQPEWQKSFLNKPVEQRLAFAEKARLESQSHTSHKPMDIMDVNQRAVEQWLLKHDVTQMIHGHTHRPQTHTFSLEGKTMTRIVLGDWYEQGSLLECTAQGCQLETLPVQQTPAAANDTVNKPGG
jgi:UDP-2,3-diacylglucosamine hydrolase